MWLLKGDNDGRLIYLKPNATMTVGRNRGDIILSDDGSISRVHAQIIVKTIVNSDQITDQAQPLSKCMIKDPGSKYGNFVLQDGEAVRITEEGYELQHKDRIRFGLQNYIFTVHYIPIITTTSGMLEGEKQKLKEIIEAIDGKVTPVWNTLCTHMTVVKPTISEKLSCALAAQTPIVPMDYWESVTDAFRTNTELPDSADFATSINNMMQEIGQVSVSPNPARKTLFRNLTFLHFSSKQFQLYARMIKLAGGRSILYSQRRGIPNVCDDPVIVVQLVESNTTQATGTGDASYAAVCEKLSECRRRTIPESEIAIAILHCSTEKYCNPRYDYAVLFQRREAENQSRDMTVLALDTQDVQFPSTSRPRQNENPTTSAPAVCIPETVTESYDTQSDTAREYPKDPTDDSPMSSGNLGAVSMQSDSVEDDLSESQIGSMKLASLNHEHYVEEEFKQRALNKDIPKKRDRDEDEDGASEAEKRICLGVSSIGKGSKKETSGPRKRDECDEEIVSDGESCRSFERKKERPGASSISIGNKRDQSGPKKLDVSYEEMMQDDEDVFFMADKVSVAKEDLEKNQRKIASRLSPAKEVKEVGITGRQGRSTEMVDVSDEDAAPKSTLVSAASRGRKDRFHTGGINLLEDSAADTNEKTHKRKIGKFDILSFPDTVENAFKCKKLEVTNDRQSDRLLLKNSSVQRPLMDVTPPSTTNRKKGVRKEEGKWMKNTWRTSPAHDHDTSEFIKLSNEPNAPVLPLLRIKTPADIYTKEGPRFGKCFRKQKITIPPRVELDGSVYEPSYVKTEPKKRASLDDDEEDATTTRKVASNSWTRAKKSSFRL